MEGVEEQGLGKKKGQGLLRGVDGKKRTEQNRRGRVEGKGKREGEGGEGERCRGKGRERE